jgi:hypothetical protein
MRTITIVSWIITGIFAILFLLRIEHLSTIETRYGSLAGSPPIILGTFLAFAIVPAIFWIIAVATAPRNKNQKIQSPNQDAEMTRIDDEISDLERKKNELKARFKLVKESHEQGLLNQYVFDKESSELRTIFNKVKEDIDIKKRRRQAIEILTPKLKKLDELLRQKIITFHEKEQKREELISNYLRRR